MSTYRCAEHLGLVELALFYLFIFTEILELLLLPAGDDTIRNSYQLQVVNFQTTLYKRFIIFKYSSLISLPLGVL